jgi:glycerophosphoryl diester phosphodiesterase
MNPFPRTLILGHRGSPREAPENTLQSFGKALLAGADGVELDVQPSGDGVPVITHDDSLERVWGIRRQVSRLGWRAVEQLTGAQVPSFEQVAGWAAASGAWVNVELKTAGVEKEVARLIDRFDIRGRVVISSFDAEIVAEIGRLDGGLRRFFLTERWDDAARTAFDRSGASGVCLANASATHPVLEDLHARDLPVIVWTVNEPERVRELLREGVAGIISDLPGMAAKERDAVLRS